jgi:hypothetical protein
MINFFHRTDGTVKHNDSKKPDLKATLSDDDDKANEDGAFENFDDDDEKKEGVTGLTDRGKFSFKTKNDKSKEETKSSWYKKIIQLSLVQLMKCIKF